MRVPALCAVLAAGLTLAGCIESVSLPPDVAPVRIPVQTTERIPINIRTSWQALTGAIEQAIPRCQEVDPDGTCRDDSDGHYIFRHEDDWLQIDRSMLGQPMGVRVAVWRANPLAISISGNHVTASITLLYRVRVGLMSGRQLASCGNGESPRELKLTLDGDLRLSPEWYLDPGLHIHLVPAARCVVSFLNIDITDTVIETVQAALQGEADDAALRIREVSNIRATAADLWSRLNQPMAIGDRVWLLPRLSTARIQLPRISPDGRYLRVTFALEGSPKVVIGAPPVPIPTPLPPLAQGNVEPAFSVKVRGLMTYSEASDIVRQHLKSALASQSLPGLRLGAVTVSGRGANVVVALEVHGFLSGTFYLFGVPRFESTRGSTATGRLTLDQPRFSFSTRSLLARLVVSSLRQRIESDLEAAAWWDVTRELQAGLDDLQRAINRQLTPQARLEGRLSEFGPGEVRVGPDGLEAWYRLGGKVGIVVAPLD